MENSVLILYYQHDSDFGRLGSSDMMESSDMVGSSDMMGSSDTTGSSEKIGSSEITGSSDIFETFDLSMNSDLVQKPHSSSVFHYCQTPSFYLLQLPIDSHMKQKI